LAEEKQRNVNLQTHACQALKETAMRSGIQALPPVAEAAILIEK
jgi:hypothetical protein